MCKRVGTQHSLKLRTRVMLSGILWFVYVMYADGICAKFVHLFLFSFQSPYEKEKASQVKRADPRRLQQENSDSVWNELAHYKQEFERLDDQR